MKKRYFMFFMALVLSMAMAVPVFAAYRDMSATVYKWTGGYNTDGSPGLVEVTTGITFKVLARDSDTAETLYVYNKRAMTSLTNPVTTTNYASTSYCNGEVRFRVDPTDATYDRYVDLIVVDTNGGYSTFVEDFDQYTRTIIIDERPNIMHHGVIWFTDSTTSEVNTGVTFLADTFIHDVRVETVTTTAGGTLNVGLLSSGTGGDADGFIAARATSTAGYTADTGFITAAASNDYYPASTYGVLLVKKVTGSATVTTRYGDGGRTYMGHIVTGSNTGVLTYTGNSAASGAGYVHYFFTRMR